MVEPFTFSVRLDRLLQLPPCNVAVVSRQAAPVPRLPDW